MSVHGRRRRSLAIAAVSVLCAAIFVGATTASAATWTGTAHGKILRANRLVSGGTTWRGNFWFTTSPSGAVRGHAVIAYEPVVDVAGLTNAIGYVRTVGSTAVGLLGPFGAAAGGAVLGQIVGAGVSFKSAMAVRRGPLRGQFTGSRLKLRWNAKLEGIPYDINFVLASGTERIGGGKAALRSPFQGAADMVDRRVAVYASEKPPKSSGGVTEMVGSYWIATRGGR
jgi:hypothetical protein